MKNKFTFNIFFALIFSLALGAQDRIGIGIFAPGTFGANPANTKFEIAINPSINFPFPPAAAEFNLIIAAPTAQLVGDETLFVTEDNVNNGVMGLGGPVFAHTDGMSYWAFSYSGSGIDLSQYGTGSMVLALSIGITGGTGTVDFSIADESTQLFADFGSTSEINLQGVNELMPFANPVTLSVVLPIQLMSFDVHKKGGDNARIFWSTASEQNASHFEVERSLDGEYWELAGKVTAIGNSFETNNYTLEDNNLKRYITSDQFIYYRLKSVDYDETFDYSGVKNIEVKFQGVAIQVYPNPATEGIYVNVNMPDRNDELTAFVKDIHGRTLDVVNLGNDKLINEYVNLNQLSAGTYFISVEGSDQIYSTERIVITNK